jgi:hypothetical protein
MLSSYPPLQQQQQQRPGYPLVHHSTAAALAARLTQDETACYLISRGGFGPHVVE